MNNHTYDFIAIGLGPFNLGLACLTDTIDELNGLFLEQKQEFNWHPGMMLESAHLQTPFMSDLVTLADPTHPLSYLNYAKKMGRLYSFYIRENFFLMRSEYNQYCRWAISQLSNVQFNRRVEHIAFDETTQIYTLTVSELDTNGQVTTQTSYQTEKLVLGTGPAPYSPPAAKPLAQAKTLSLHSSAYLKQKQTLQKQSSITIVGSGQSAAEIYYDLLQDIDSFNYELNWVTRSPRFFPLEYSKLTLEMTSPEYVDYFYNLPADKRDELIAKQKHLYKGINTDLINDIYDLLYVKRLQGPVASKLITNATLTDSSIERSVESNDDNNNVTLNFHQDEQDVDFTLTTQAVVFATGYHYQVPSFLQSIAHHIAWDHKGRFAVKRNYSIDQFGSSIFIQNAELHTHGFVSPDLGMACYRNSYIIKEILGYEYYPIEKRIAFQDFSAPLSTSDTTMQKHAVLES